MVEELLSTFQKGNFYFSTFREVCRTREQGSQIISRQSSADLMNAGLVGEGIDVDTTGENSPPVLYEEYVVEILRVPVMLACKGNFTFRRRHSGRELLVMW